MDAQHREQRTLAYPSKSELKQYQWYRIMQVASWVVLLVIMPRVVLIMADPAAPPEETITTILFCLPVTAFGLFMIRRVILYILYGSRPSNNDGQS